MQRITEYWRVIGLAAVVAAALAIGGSQAFAAASRTCTYAPPDLLGTCDGDCQGKCDAVWGPGHATGVCNSADCCLCFAN